MGRRARLRAAHGRHRILNTATVLDTVVGVHHTATVDKPWDAGANKKRLPDPLTVATAKKMFAWYDSSRVENGELPKDACSFPHHEVSADGTVGAANLAGCRNGLARLAGSNVPSSEQEGVRRHLQAHLDDGKSSTSDAAGTLPRAEIRSRAAAQLEAHGRQGTSGQTWYRIENLVQTPGVASVYLYGEIGMWGITAEDFVRDLQAVNASQLDLHINSMGGEVFEAIAILNALRSHPAAVTTYVDSLAASSASVVAMAGSKVVMGRNSTLMIHDAHAIEIGNASVMQAMANLLNKTSDNIASVYAEKAGGDIAQWRQVMQAETWFSAEEAVAAGLADEVDTSGQGAAQESAAAQDLMTATFDLSVFRYPGRDAAPAPAIAAPSNSAEEPVAPPAVEETPVAPSEPDPVPVEPQPDLDDQGDPPPPAPVVATAATPAAPSPAADQWAAMTRGLLQDAAPPTVGALLARLRKEGQPA